MPISLIVARHFAAEPGDGAFLRGILNGLYFSAFPTPPTALAFYFSLTDGAGEGELGLEVIEWRGSFEPHVIYRKSRWYQFLSDPLMIMNGAVITEQLVFRQPGIHFIRLVFEGHLVTERRLFIYQI